MGIKTVQTENGYALVNDGEPCEHAWEESWLEEHPAPGWVTRQRIWFCHLCLTGRVTDPETDRLLEEWAGYGTPVVGEWWEKGEAGRSAQGGSPQDVPELNRPANQDYSS